jgi:hypothetical protein
MDNTRLLLTALFVTTDQNRFSAAEAGMKPVDEKQGLGIHAKCNIVHIELLMHCVVMAPSFMKY